MRSRTLVLFALVAAASITAGAAPTAEAKGKPKSAGATRARRPKTRATRERPPARVRAVTLATPRARPLGVLATRITCPSDMVAVAGRVCVDRYEMSLVDDASGAEWSPFYAPDPERAQRIADAYEIGRRRAYATSLDALTLVPPPPAFTIHPRAVSKAGVIPQGYLSADEAERACQAAHKRLCTEAEWVTACEGEWQTSFPYGERYERGACNVDRESHPSLLLHANAARYHDDPRNNLVTFDGRPLLQKTGSSPACASRWGDDEIFDMVGNLDEWTADARGVFAGGFYSRPTRSGCSSRVSNHPRAYSDYSTGARCCQDG